MDFQVLDIGDDDHNFKYNVTLYGKNENNENIVCHIKNYQPSFYVRVPKDDIYEFKNLCEVSLRHCITKEIKSKNKDIDEEELDEQVGKKMYFYTDENCPYYCGMKYSELCQKKSFYNFSFSDEDEYFFFYKLSFTTAFSMMKYVSSIKNYYLWLQTLKEVEPENDIFKNNFITEWLLLKEKNCDCEANLYEAKTSPMLKFIHDTNIKSCGWIHIDKGCYTSRGDQKIFNCEHEYYDIDYKDIKIVDKDDIANFRICSFDIECDSSHGDFPNPRKDFKKLASDTYDFIIKNKNVEKSFIILIIELILHQSFGIAENNNIADINHTNCSHKIKSIKDFNKKINIKELKDEFTKTTIFDNVDDFFNTKNRNKYIKEICKVFDKHLKYIDKKGIYHNITVDGDPVIQIGNVFYDYVKKEYKRVIVVYKENVPEDQICDPLDDYDIEIIRCNSERELLVKWADIMCDYSPDYITGYNIFGFDFNFICERVDILFPCPIGSDGRCMCKEYNKSVDHCKHCPKSKFYKIGRILQNDKDKFRNKECKSIDKELSSSGLGDNILKFIQMDGRILFDMQKEVQKGHALESYKLDNVSSHFMKGKVKVKKSWNRALDGKKVFVCDLETKNLGFLKKGDYINLNIYTKWGNYKFQDKKYLINSIIQKQKVIKIVSDKDLLKETKKIVDCEYIEWSLAKDDILPQDIFDCQKNNDTLTLTNGIKVTGPQGRALVAKYCIMDCELVIHLVLLLDIITNNQSMATVCSVPQSFIFLRGQGIKVLSLVTKECNKVENNILIPTLKAFDPNNKEGFEGAIVLDPVQRNTTGMYLEDPIAVVDYASLYPSSIIENNFSHDTYICTEKEYLENPEKYNNFKEIKDFKYSCATYGDYEFTEKFKKGDNVVVKEINEKRVIAKVEKSKDEEDDTKYYLMEEDDKKYIAEQLTKIEDKKWDKNKLDTETTCYFKSQFNNYDEEKGPKYGIIPKILKTLLDERSATKKRMKQAKTEDKKKVLDGFQLSYKITANSVYGAMGAKTSAIFFKKLAACTTAIGRQRIYDAENGTIEWVNSDENNLICKDENIVKKEDRARIVYGDTDSVFIKFSRYDLNGNLLTGPDAIKHCIECGIKAGAYVTDNYLNLAFKGLKYQGVPIDKSKFKGPQDLEYEKTFENFILISKKRYIGDKHELEYLEDPKRTSMGIVMKRRDNAPIVKYVYGNLLEILMREKNLDKAKKWLDTTLDNINTGKMSKDNIDMFVITKSLRGYYKNPQTIAHKVLADRIAERDPGNKPKPNDRIPYAYYELEDDRLYDFKNKYKSGKRKGQPKKKNILQGDRIEHRDYILKNNLALDYKFYISNQIMKPVKQLLEIQLDEPTIDGIFNKYIAD